MPRHHIPDARKEDVVRLRRTESIQQTADKLDMSTSTVKRVMRNARDDGRVSRPARVKGRRRKLSYQDVTFLQGCVEQKPDMMLFELRRELNSICGIDAGENTISRCLKRRGYTRKKVSRTALEANEDDQTQYMLAQTTFYPPRTLVFVDESACNRFTTNRTMAWAPIGERAHRHDYFVRGIRYSILPALSLDGLLHLRIQDHSYTGDEFLHFIDGLLDHMEDYPGSNSVIVMDNASIHKSEELQEHIEARGKRVLYLPAYSPHLNPIEEGFSSMKSWIRANRSYALEALADENAVDPYLMLTEAVSAALTPANARGWFRHSGYVDEGAE